MRRLILWLLPVALLTFGFVLTSEAVAQSKPAVEKAKKKQAKKVKVLVLKVDNLKGTKPAKLKALKKSLKKIEGVVKVRPRPKKGALVIRHRPGADVDAIRAMVTKAGFSISGDRAAPAPAPTPAEEEGPGLDEPIPEE